MNFLQRWPYGRYLPRHRCAPPELIVSLSSKYPTKQALFFRVFQESVSKGETAERGARDTRDGGVAGAPRSLRAWIR